MRNTTPPDALSVERFAGQIRRELLLLARTGGELTLLEAALGGRESAAAALGKRRMRGLDSDLLACLMDCRELCDSLGLVGEGRYALLLPGIGVLRARLMAEQLQRAFAPLAARLCAAGRGKDAEPPCCAVGIASADQGRKDPPALLRQCGEALDTALAQPNGHICIAGGEALDQRNTLVHSSEKRFLFFGSN